MNVIFSKTHQTNTDEIPIDEELLTEEDIKLLPSIKHQP